MTFWEFVKCIPGDIGMAMGNMEPILKWVKWDWNIYKRDRAERLRVRRGQ